MPATGALDRHARRIPGDLEHLGRGPRRAGEEPAQDVPPRLEQHQAQGRQHQPADVECLPDRVQADGATELHRAE